MSIDVELAILSRFGADVILDVGANVGQTGQAFRGRGFAGRIVSFEPLEECHARLAAVAAADPAWQTLNMALGAVDGPSEIGVSENLVSSSLLPATDRLIAIHAPVRYVRRQPVEVARLDSLFDDLVRPGERVHLKIDTQGFEAAVIEGASGVLPRIGTVRMEVAVSEVYAGETTVPQMILDMERRGYVLIEAWPAWRHPRTQEVLHFDLMFRRSDLAGT